jgi:hypothetical protein
MLPRARHLRNNIAFPIYVGNIPRYRCAEVWSTLTRDHLRRVHFKPQPPSTLKMHSGDRSGDIRSHSSTMATKGQWQAVFPPTSLIFQAVVCGSRAAHPFSIVTLRPLPHLLRNIACRFAQRRRKHDCASDTSKLIQG